MIQSWFSASLLQSLVSHDPSKIIIICWFHAQETFIIIIIIITIFYHADDFVETMISIFFQIFVYILYINIFVDIEYKVQKNSTYLKSFCYIINVIWTILIHHFRFFVFSAIII